MMLKKPFKYRDRLWTRAWSCQASLLVVVVAMTLSFACGGAKKGQAAPAPVTSTDAVVKDVASVVRSVGSVEAYKTVAIKAQVSGQLTKVHFKEGQDVRKGDLLFTIDARPFNAALDQAKAQLARDKAQLETVEAQARRYGDLVKKDFVTQQQYGDAKANADSLRATLQADEANVEDAQLNLAYCFIKAPIGGRLGNLLVQEGNLVKANDTQVLVTLNQITPTYVTFSVPEEKFAEIRRIEEGDPMTVSASLPADPKTTFTGDLSFFNNTVDSASGTILLKATFPNQDKSLWPGQFANVTVVLSTIKDAVVVPAESIQQGQQGSYLYVIKPDMTVEMRTVKTGQVLDGEAIVEEGVKGGEKIVTDGQLRLFPGARVEIASGLQPGGSAALAQAHTG